MKTHPISAPLGVAAGFLLLSLQWAAAADQMLIIGDSLSKEYEYEWAGIGGDAGVTPVMNWAEILDDRRHTNFDFGTSATFNDLRLIAHHYNWSVPGAFAHEWWDKYLSAGSPAKYVYGIPELEDQISNEAERIVIFLGGNEVRSEYGNLYDGNLAPATFANALFNDLEDIVNWVMDRKRSTAEVVLVNVPHLGACPAKNDPHPYNATKTGRVTSALVNVNNRLATLAQSKGIGLADVYSPMLSLVTSSYLCIGTVPIYRYPPRSDGNSRYAFLGDGLHPNMPIQALFAQRILDAFNAKYNHSYARLTNQEILTSLLGLSPTQIFDDWALSKNVPVGSRGLLDDGDRDGVKNMLEFALDLDPTKPDSKKLPQPEMFVLNGQTYVGMTARLRIQECPLISLTVEQSNNLQAWTAVPANTIFQNPDGTTSVRIARAPNSPPLYLRIRANLIPPG